MTDPSESNPADTPPVDHRDFPRLHVEAKVRIAGTAADHESADQPAVVSDLSLGGARMATPASLDKGDRIGIIPFTGLLDDHPLHRVLEFEVMWVGGTVKDRESGKEWREYGLLHHGSVLDVLNSWLGHLLLRREPESSKTETRRNSPRVHFEPETEPPMMATLSHDRRTVQWTLLDLASGGLVARSDVEDIPIGVHLAIKSGWESSDEDLDSESLWGCVVDSHSHSGSTFYRVAFDPESELDDEQLVNWAQSVGGQFEP